MMMKRLGVERCMALIAVALAWPSLAIGQQNIVQRLKVLPIVKQQRQGKRSATLMSDLKRYQEHKAKQQAQGVLRGKASWRSATARVDFSERIQLYVDVTASDLAPLKQAGLEVELFNRKLGKVQGWLPISRLSDLEALSTVRAISLPSYAVLRVGSVMTQGDAILGGDRLRDAGIDGSGVKVGVISDGGNDIATSVASGDLPSGIQIYGTCGLSTSCNEGTAMLEIIHDMAPGAQLALGAITTHLDFIDRVDKLVNDFGADVVVDDVGFYFQPRFEHGEVAEAVAAVTDQVVFVSAAGNDGTQGYESLYIDNLGYHDFGLASGAASYPVMRIGLAAGATLQVVLQWNDLFGAATNDYGVVLYNEALSTVLAVSSRLDVDENPQEILLYTAGDTDMQLNLAVQRVAGDAKVIDVSVLGGQVLTYGESANTIFGHPAVEDAIAVGAIAASDIGHDTIEWFSSQGPVEIYHPSRATLTKPDVAGIDGVRVTGVGGFGSPFYGTSAAAPHVAAVAALLMSEFSLAPAQVRSVLKDGAADCGVSGVDTVYGAGRVSAFDSVRQLQAEPDSVITSPAADVTVRAGETLTFAGECANSQVVGNATYAWNFGGAGIGGTTVQNPGERTLSTEGSFTVAFTCIDGFNQADPTPATRVVTVTEAPDSNDGGGGGGSNVTSSGCALQPGRWSLTGLGVLLVTLIGLFAWRRRLVTDDSPCARG